MTKELKTIQLRMPHGRNGTRRTEYPKELEAEPAAGVYGKPSRAFSGTPKTPPRVSQNSAVMFGHEEMKTPEDYIRYMASDRPKEGGLTIDPGWFQLWSPDQLDVLNCEYKTQDFVPGFWGFGSSGGGELLAFDTLGQVFMIPFIPMEPDEAVKIARSWQEFESRMEK